MAQIHDLNESWLNHSGLEVQEFVRAQLAQLTTLVNSKFGAAEYSEGTISFYDQDNGNLLSTLRLTGDIYTIDIGYTESVVFSVLTGDPNKYITITPVTMHQTGIGVAGEIAPERYDYVVAFSTGGAYTNRISGENISTATFDIKNYLATGTNYVRITVTGRDFHSVRSIVLTVTLTNLTFSCSHVWNTPWNAGSDYVLNGIIFSGNITKTLHVAVSMPGDVTPTEVYSHSYGPMDNHDTSPEIVTISAADFPLGANDASGPCVISVWLTGDGVETPHATYNILCLQANETAALVCVNNALSEVVNFATNRLFDFYTVNCDHVEVDITVMAGGQEYHLGKQSIGNLTNYMVQSLTTSFEVPTQVGTGDVAVMVTPWESDQEYNYDGIVELTMGMDNHLAFTAVDNPSLYFSAGSRNNGSSDRENITYSEVTPTLTYEGVWNGVAWSTDGWYEDADGHRALALPAGCSVDFPTLQPFSFISTASQGGGVTIEFMFRASVVADLNTPIITFSDVVEGPEGTDVTVGCEVYPAKIRVLTDREQRTLAQEVGLCEDVITHIVITLQRNYSGSGKNLCSIYVNGIPNVSFDYNSNSTFGIGGLHIGQASTDTYLYMMRIYNRALEGTGILQNFLNAIFNGVEFNRESVRDANNIYDGGIQYSDALRRMYNCFIIEPDNPNQAIPSFYNPATVQSTVYLEYADHHEWDVKIANCPVDGQGTTSMQYFRWNLRGKFANEKTENNVTTPATAFYYSDGSGSEPGAYSETPSFTGKKGGYLDGGSSGGLHSKVTRFTAKKNVASSQQGHKMGATALYDDLFTAMGLKSELPDDSYRVAVWQYPFLGFVRNKVTGECQFIGLYTIGPDKGCKTTFGYKDGDVGTDNYDMCMCIEGPNHAPRGTRFLTPWVDVTYDATAKTGETLRFGGQEAWDDDYTANYDSDDASKASEILQMYVSEWKPAYDLVYHCSPYIASWQEACIDDVPVSELCGSSDEEDIIAYVNNHMTDFSAVGQYSNGEKNNLLSFYDEGYNIWYREISNNVVGGFTKLVRQDYDTADYLWNIVTYLRGTNDQNGTDYLSLTGAADAAHPTTAEIVAARVAKFKAEIGRYFSLNQTLYHKNFCMLIGAKDNDAKNSYPFKHLSLAAGGRWGWKQDDLDSIFDTDNNGMATVKYSAEHGDLSDGQEIFQGSDSAFWTLIWRYYQAELGAQMSTMMSRLQDIAIARNLVSGSNIALHTYVNAALAYYFFDRSAKYFPIIAYQEDRKYAYIEPWRLAGTIRPGTSEAYKSDYNSVAPLTQALGDRYQDERLWIERRIAYLFSKYKLGVYATAGAAWGQIMFTLSVAHEFRLTPAIDLYPVASFGGAPIRAARTMAGEVATLTMTSDPGTGNYILGANWLSSLGDLSGLVLTNRTGASDKPFSVTATRLETLKVGDENPANVSFNATSLAVSSKALQIINALNVTSLVNNEVDLRGCTRLRRVLFGGSSAIGLLLPNGSRITEVSFPENLQDLLLYSQNQLEISGITMSETCMRRITSFYYYKCTHLNPLTILSSIVAANGNLSYIHLVWDGTFDASPTDIATLVSVISLHDVEYTGNNLVYDVDHGAYIDGTIQVDIIDEDDYNLLVGAEDDETDHGVFPNLTINYRLKLQYIHFVDNRVKELFSYYYGDTIIKTGLINNGSITGDGDSFVYSLYTFASTTAIPRHLSAGGDIIEPIDAHSEQFVIEIEGEVHDIIIQRKDVNTTAVTTVAQYSVDESEFTRGDNKYSIEITHPSTGNYLRVGVKADEGANVSWSIISPNGTRIPYGMTIQQAEAVTGFSNRFQYNTLITSLDELKYFIGISNLGNNTVGAFRGCSELERVTLPSTLENLSSATSILSFNSCTNLSSFNFNGAPLEAIGGLSGSSLKSLTLPQTIKHINGEAFRDTPSMNVMHILGKIEYLGNSCWTNNNMTLIEFCNTGEMAFTTNPGSTGNNNTMVFGYIRGSSNNIITASNPVKIVIHSTTPPILTGINHFYSTSYYKIYVPDAAVDTYKAADKWSSYASNILPLSEYPSTGDALIGPVTDSASSS